MGIPNVLSIVTLGVADVAAAQEFYQRLGWRRADSSMTEIVWFDLGGAWLGLFGTDDLAADAGLAPAGPPANFRGVTLALNVASEKVVDEGLQAAVAAGGSLVKPGTRADWGGYSGYFADPDGHLWELAWNPMFPIGRDGRITIP
jgi:uncharacterized protein